MRAMLFCSIKSHSAGAGGAGGTGGAGILVCAAGAASTGADAGWTS